MKRENLIIAESFVVSNFLKTVLFCTSDFAWFKIYEEHRNFSQIDGVSGKSLTYGELEYEVVKYAEYFRQLGINKGDVVCICGSNVPQFAHVFLAATGIGAAVTIANGQLTPRKQTFIYLQTKFKFLLQNWKKWSGSFHRNMFSYRRADRSTKRFKSKICICNGGYT